MRRKLLHTLFSVVLLITGTLSYARDFPTQSSVECQSADTDVQFVVMASSGQEMFASRAVRQRRAVRQAERRQETRTKRGTSASLWAIGGVSVWQTTAASPCAFFRGEHRFFPHKFKSLVSFLQTLF